MKNNTTVDTNGVIEIKTNAVKQILRFSVHACLEFENRMHQNTVDNPFKILTDLVFSGMFGEAMRNSTSAPNYSDAYDLVEKLAEEDLLTDYGVKIWTTYNHSKYGSDFIKRIEELNKKKGELEEENK